MTKITRRFRRLSRKFYSNNAAKHDVRRLSRMRYWSNNAAKHDVRRLAA